METPTDPFQALLLLPKLMEDYKATAEKLIKAEQELNLLRNGEQYVDIKWVAKYWSVTQSTARDMIKSMSTWFPKSQVEVKVLCYGQRVVRYRRSDIEKVTNLNLISLKSLVEQKRQRRANRE